MSPVVMESGFHYLWNPESWALESETAQEVRNSTNDWKKNPLTGLTGIQYLESGMHDLESIIQDFLGFLIWTNDVLPPNINL